MVSGLLHLRPCTYGNTACATQLPCNKSPCNKPSAYLEWKLNAFSVMEKDIYKYIAFPEGFVDINTSYMELVSVSEAWVIYKQIHACVLILRYLK